LIEQLGFVLKEKELGERLLKITQPKVEGSDQNRKVMPC
jgi:hypothetical protein